MVVNIRKPLILIARVETTPKMEPGTGEADEDEMRDTDIDKDPLEIKNECPNNYEEMEQSAGKKNNKLIALANRKTYLCNLIWGCCCKNIGRLRKILDV